jgi:hypothetical protein
MISFILSAWWFWWMFAIAVTLRWFHVMCARNRASARFAHEEEEAYDTLWKFVHDSQAGRGVSNHRISPGASASS